MLNLDVLSPEVDAILECETDGVRQDLDQANSSFAPEISITPPLRRNNNFIRPLLTPPELPTGSNLFAHSQRFKFERDWNEEFQRLLEK